MLWNLASRSLKTGSCMHTISRFSLRKTPTSANELHANDQPTGIPLDGRRIEAQFELDSGEYLLWLTDDSPYDEGLHIYLLDDTGPPIDAIEAGADFTAGIPRIQATGRDWVLFEFFTNGVSYRLDILERPVFRWRLPPGWRYKRKLRRHRLIVTEASGEAKI